MIAGYPISIGNATDVGKHRAHNEDYLAHFPTSFGYCIVVCDGMGGHAAGEVAAQHATAAIREYLEDGQNTKADAALCLTNAIEFANFRLREMVREDKELSGMGTTCVIALLKGTHFYLAHAGDSRAYLIRNGEIQQVTKDHSSVQEMIDNGVLTEEEAAVSDKRNQISKALGLFEKVAPTVTKTPLPLKHDDKILLCSDGLKR